MSIKKQIINRLGIIYFVLIFFGVAVIIRIILIQTIYADKWKKLTKSLQHIEIQTAPIRGDILSDNGNLLATSMPGYYIRIDLASQGVKKVFKQEVDSLAYQLASFFGNQSAEAWKKELTKAYQKKQRGFMLTPRKIDHNELKMVENFSIIRHGQFKGGKIVEQEYKRVLPFQQLAKRTIGQLNKGIWGGQVGSIGYTGLEGLFEHYLKGTGGISYKQNISGRWMEVPVIEPQSGYDINTTINIQLQDILNQALLRQLIKSDASWGSAILMETETGNVKAISNLKQIAPGEYDETYNYALGHEGCFEPGSTFKLMSVIVALEEGCVDLDTKINIEHGSWKYKDKTIYDSDYGHTNDTWLTLEEIFKKSSNVGIAKMVVNCFGDRPKEYTARLYNMHINKPLNLGFTGECTPFFKYPNESNWWGTTLAWMSYGYESKMSPMQILTFYNAIANHGVMIKPKFVNNITYQGKLIKQFKTEVIKSSVASKATIAKAQHLLEEVCKSGTGTSVQPSSFTVAGKTGTAQLATSSHGYQKGAYMSSFAGYFPAEKPVYSMIVVISNPRGAYYGASVAGPVFKETAEKSYALYTQSQAITTLVTKGNNIPGIKKSTPNKLNAASKALKLQLPMHTTPTFSNNNQKQMPNLCGINASDAVYLAKLYQLQPHITGNGKVVKQIPPKGTKVQKGQNVYLILN